MRDQQEKSVNGAESLPPLFTIHCPIPQACGERNIEHFARDLKGNSMLDLVQPVLFLIPFESHLVTTLT